MTIELFMDLFGILLVAIWIAKLLAVFNAVQWIRNHGPSYRKAFFHSQPHTKEEYCHLMEEQGGCVPPISIFGKFDRLLVHAIISVSKWLHRPFAMRRIIHRKCRINNRHPISVISTNKWMALKEKTPGPKPSARPNCRQMGGAYALLRPASGSN